jgi:hypothetical protein
MRHEPEYFPEGGDVPRARMVVGGALTPTLSLGPGASPRLVFMLDELYEAVRYLDTLAAEASALAAMLLQQQEEPPPPA